MKTLTLIIFLMPATIYAQWWDPLGILGVEVNGNTAILKNDSAWRNCGATYEMIIYQLEGDTLGWYQKGIGLTNCDCLFNLSVTIDSLNPGDYFVKTSFEDSYSGDTIYIGLIEFTILEQNTFNGFVKTDEYQSPCGIVVTGETDHTANSLTIGPNPANDQIIIRSLETSQNTIFQIFNLNGLRLISGKSKSDKTEIDISSLPPGVYIIRVVNEKQSKVAKLVKE